MIHLPSLLTVIYGPADIAVDPVEADTPPLLVRARYRHLILVPHRELH